MEKAETLTRASGYDEIGDCVALASAYVHDLNDSTKAEIWRQRVAEAARHYGTNGWLHAAITAKKIHSANRQLALQYMEHAEASAKDHRDRIATAETWKRVFRNKKPANAAYRKVRNTLSVMKTGWKPPACGSANLRTEQPERIA